MDVGREPRIASAGREQRPLFRCRENADVAAPPRELLEGREEVLPGRLQARVNRVDEVEAERAAEQR